MASSVLGAYALWAVFLLAQSAANTFVSRARNSGSYGLHAYAALASNGVWISQQFVGLGLILDAIDAIRRHDYMHPAMVIAFYCAMTVAGSVGMHYVQRTYIEKGNRRVGA